MVVQLQRPVLVGHVCPPQPAEHRLGDPVQLVQTNEGVDLGDLGGELRGVALRHAPRHDQAAQAPAALPLRHLEDGFDGLAFRVLDETASVNDHDFGVVDVGHNPRTPLNQVTEHDLPVHQVFGAPEPYHSDLD